jgi:hypothetical protein
MHRPKILKKGQEIGAGSSLDTFLCYPASTSWSNSRSKSEPACCAYCHQFLITTLAGVPSSSPPTPPPPTQPQPQPIKCSLRGCTAIYCSEACRRDDVNLNGHLIYCCGGGRDSSQLTSDFFKYCRSSFGDTSREYDVLVSLFTPICT